MGGLMDGRAPVWTDGQARSSKMNQDDFLRLLAVFNSAGVHFA